MKDLLSKIDSGLDECGVTTGPWKISGCGYVSNGDIVITETGESCNQPDARLIAQCREAFKALIKLTYLEYYTEYSAFLENGWDDDESSHKALLSVAGYASIIESGTGWTWEEWQRWLR